MGSRIVLDSDSDKYQVRVHSAYQGQIPVAAFAALDVHLEETKFVVELGSTAEEQQKQAEIDAIKVQPEWVTRNQFEKEDAAQGAAANGEDAKDAAAKPTADNEVQEQYLQALLSALQKQQGGKKPEDKKEEVAADVAAAVDDMFDEWEDV